MMVRYGWKLSKPEIYPPMVDYNSITNLELKSHIDRVGVILL
jgi:hypothetical protein